MSTLDPSLIAFVKQKEGFTSPAVWDYQQWTNGYGTRAHFPREKIGVAEAERRLEVELSAAQASVVAFAPNLPSGVENALTDLTFNEGVTWQHAGLGELIKARDWSGAKSRLLQYDEAGGHVLSGLEARRMAEAAWFPTEAAA